MNSPLASVAEAKIKESLEAGEDERLASQGKPIDLTAYFAAPSALRAAFGVLKGAGMVPPEVEAMREVNRLRERLAVISEGDEREMLRRELQTREVELAIALERMKRQIKADATS